MRAIGAYVIFEGHTPELSPGGLYLGSENRYPNQGWVVAVGDGCSEDIRPGDFIVIPDHGASYAPELYDTVVLRLRGDGGDLEVRVKFEYEPMLREAWARFQANPSTHDERFAVEDVEGQAWTLRISDVIDVMSGAVTEGSGLDLSYRHVTEIPDRPNHYRVSEAEILCTIAPEED